MKRSDFCAFAALLICGFGIGSAVADDSGFTAIYDQDHTDGWQHVGGGDVKAHDGILSTVSPEGSEGGVFWYARHPFGDFILRTEFKVDTATSNSGIYVRFPDPSGSAKTLESKGYEVDIYGGKTGTIVVHGHKARPAKTVSLTPGSWNDCEVTAIGQKFEVRLNGQLVNEYDGDQALSGFIGLQNWHGDGEVHFRNVRIKELAAASDAGIAAAGEAPKSDETYIGILSEQAPNALEWALAPLDRTLPPDIRRNLVLLRENLLDEAAKKPAASTAAYKIGQQLCNSLIGTLNEREQAVVRAGYRATQVEANIAVTNQALEARMRFMNWPKYHREKDQREELRREKENGASLSKQKLVVEWADRDAVIRRDTDALYAQFREAMRGK